MREFDCQFCGIHVITDDTGDNRTRYCSYDCQRRAATRRAYEKKIADVGRKKRPRSMPSIKEEWAQNFAAEWEQECRRLRHET